MAPDVDAWDSTTPRGTRNSGGHPALPNAAELTKRPRTISTGAIYGRTFGKILRATLRIGTDVHHITFVLSDDLTNAALNMGELDASCCQCESLGGKPVR